jgi:aryl-alcohol dehydrogenase-like predicted oxidoreductase
MQKVPFGKLGFEVSRLGFGMMRLPTMENDQGEQRN